MSQSFMKSRFAKPNLVSFDLWGTLFTPKKPIAEQYYAISKNEFGLDKLVQSIGKEFPVIFKAMLQQYPNYGKYSTDISSSNAWWQELITRLYGLSRDDEMTKQLSLRLLDHFSGKDAYTLYEDVIPVLRTLQKNSVQIIGATNSDHRVLSVLDSLGIGHFFPKSSVFLSYDIGVAKPSADFFRTIAEEYYHPNGGTMAQFLGNVWHIGDHYGQDFMGAIESGWNAVLLERGESSPFLRKVGLEHLSLVNEHDYTHVEDGLTVISNNRVCASSLAQVVLLFPLEN